MEYTLDQLCQHLKQYGIGNTHVQCPGCDGKHTTFGTMLPGYQTSRSHNPGSGWNNNAWLCVDCQQYFDLEDCIDENSMADDAETGDCNFL